MRIALAVLLIAAFTAGCVIPRPATLIIKRTVPFKEGLKVPEQIREDCGLENKLARYVEPFSRRHFEKTSIREVIPPTTDAEVLTMKITDLTVEKIKGMKSGPTSLTVEGVLTKNGVVIGSFTAFRDAGEELVTRDRGECHFLKFCAKAIGKDISRWLGKPEMNALLLKSK